MDSAEEWAREQFGKIGFGDARLSRRAIQIAGQMARRPGGSLPKQMRKWAFQKAAYRFLDNAAVSYQTLCAAHWEKTRHQAGQAGKVVLMVQDITELDYSSHRSTGGLGPIGNHEGAGLMVHNTLAIEPATRRVLGLADQQVWMREDMSHKRTESKTQRRKRGDRQSNRWGKAVAAIGAPPPGVQWVYVADREADIYAFYQQTRASGVDFCVRIVQNRHLVDAKTQANPYLLEQLRGLPAMGYRSVDLPASSGHPKRRAKLAISWQAVQLRSPRIDTGPDTTFPAWALRTWEQDPPRGLPLVEWLLLISVPVENQAEALERLGWYTCRWIVEV